MMNSHNVKYGVKVKCDIATNHVKVRVFSTQMSELYDLFLFQSYYTVSTHTSL